MPIHPTAIIDSLASVDPTATIGPYVVIEGPVRIGPECRIDASAVILGHTEIGAGSRVHPHAVIGDVPQDRAFAESETFCRIGNECIIREGVTIHRGTVPGSATILGNRCFLLTNSHVGHNCVLGDGVTLISGALLGGHVDVGAGAVVSGNAAVHQFVRIGELAMISGLAKIVKDVPPFFMTDRDGAIVGVNRVGLMCAGMTSDEREELRTAYGIMYRSGIGRKATIEALSDLVTRPAGRRLLEFVAKDSSRGVMRKSLHKRPAA